MYDKKPLKVCFFTGSQNLSGGTERACADVASLLLDGKFETVILSQYSGLESGFPVSDSVGLSQLFSKKPKGFIGAFRTSLKLFFYVKEKRPDFVVFVESISFLYALPLFLLREKPSLINWEHFNAQSTLGLRSRGVARWLAASLSDRIVVLSDTDIGIWQRLYPASIGKLIRIFNVNPCEKYLSTAHSHCSVNKRFKRVLAVGRLTKQKGFDLLLDAWASIPVDDRSGWKLRIVGEGEERPLLERRIETLGLGADVELVGHSESVFEEFSEADLFVLSSRFEGFGLVILEALSFGLPVVSFDCVAGPREIIAQDINGKLVSPLNVDGLAASLAELMLDGHLRCQLSANTAFGLERFSRSNIGQRWVTLLTSLLIARG